MTDAQLLGRLQAQDEEALGLINMRYKSYVMTVLLNVIGPDGGYEDAEELCSDVFLGLWRNAASVEPGKLKAYLGVSARNRGKSWLR